MGYISDGVNVKWGRKRWHVWFEYGTAGPEAKVGLMLLGSVRIHGAIGEESATELARAIQARMQHAGLLELEWSDPVVIAHRSDLKPGQLPMVVAEASQLGWRAVDRFGADVEAGPGG